MANNYSWFTQPALRNRGSTNSNPNQLSILDSLSKWFNEPAQNNRGMSTQEAIQQYNPSSIQNSPIVNDNLIPLIQTSPYKDTNLPDAQIQALLHQTQTIPLEQPKTNILGEQVPMQNLDSGVGYVNGKLFDSNKNSFSRMFDGYSKERDAAIDPKTGKIDRNSNFYKRNKQAMENL